MTRTVRIILVALFALGTCAAVPAEAQPAPGSTYSQDELDQLLAPIALYPDQLLTQVLIAATYPLEVVEAARFVRRNPSLVEDALDQAIADKNWDPSVQSLAAFPQVLAMMDDRLEWTQRLGDAFLADEQRVMDTVQALRKRAETAGNLQSTPQQMVLDQGREIIIQPVQPEVIYVPVYDPFYVYGPWWAPAYPPWFWDPPTFYGYPVVITGIVFGRPCRISHHHWDWAHPDWRGHRIAIDGDNNRFWNRPGHPPPAGGTWEHSPGHRRGIAYPNASTRERFTRVDPEAVRARQQYRGYDLRTPNPQRPNVARFPQSAVQPAPSVSPTPRTSRTAPRVTSPPGVPPTPRVARPPSMPQAVPQQRTASPFDPGVSRQQAQANAQRGVQSRQSMGPAPAGRAPPARAAPQGGGRQR